MLAILKRHKIEYVAFQNEGAEEKYPMKDLLI